MAVEAIAGTGCVPIDASGTDAAAAGTSRDPTIAAELAPSIASPRDGTDAADVSPMAPTPSARLRRVESEPRRLSDAGGEEASCVIIAGPTMGESVASDGATAEVVSAAMLNPERVTAAPPPPMAVQLSGPPFVCCAATPPCIAPPLLLAKSCEIASLTADGRRSSVSGRSEAALAASASAIAMV